MKKIVASRLQDVGDLSRMLGLASEEELVPVRAVVARHAPGEADDVESLIYLGQLEMSTPPQEEDEIEPFPQQGDTP